MIRRWQFAPELLVSDMCELASLYTLNVLSSDEARQFEAHLSACPPCQEDVRATNETMAALALAAPVVEPPPGLRKKLLKSIRPPNVAALVRANDGKWSPSEYPGVESKILFYDRATGNLTSLVRMSAGASFPAHRHVGFEQIYVLEGDCVFDDHTLFAGDFEVNSPSTEHSIVRSRTGCICLLMNNSHDVLLTSPSAASD